MSDFKNTQPDTAQPVQCLALDIGGVFYADVWETVFENGLTEHYRLDPAWVMKQGAKIWDEHGHKTSSEDAYWKSWEDALGHPLDKDLIASLVEKHVWKDLSAITVIEKCLERNIAVCFVSNSTSFWFDRQMTDTGLSAFRDRITAYLSHETGYPKTHPKGGLSKLIKAWNPSEILFVDDRQGNIDAANQLGLQTLFYQRRAGLTLAQTLEKTLFGISPATPGHNPALIGQPL
jgi:FMN phosphatase YigB (HAD superfamily)